jgi:hypothetical protein
MNPADYVIDHADRDWAGLLRGWGDLLPAKFDIVLVNKFGDVVVILEDRSVHLLDVGAGVMLRLADDLAEFLKLLPHYATNWLMAPLADACAANGLTLGPDQCYSYRTPPLLGGAYELSNFYIAAIEAHYGFLGDLHRQTCEMPDGARVRQKRLD